MEASMRLECSPPFFSPSLLFRQAALGFRFLSIGTENTRWNNALWFGIDVRSLDQSIVQSFLW